jgi:4-amino-4-deoxy-L-arabinose transferase-like glycosyltransferase
VRAETEKQNFLPDGIESRYGAITAGQVAWAFVGLFVLNLLLRLFYLRFDFLTGDEGVRALTADRMLDGARLYADVVTDKPPGTTLFYAAVFATLGQSMKAVHVLAALWHFGTSIIIYLLSARLYGRRIAIYAALLFIYFSANYHTHDMIAANTELLMAMPYTASVYLYIKTRRAGRDEQSVDSALVLVAAGLMTGVATMFKQVGALNLAFFFLLESIPVFKNRASAIAIKRALARLAWIVVGFASVLAVLVAWLAYTDALAGFWRNTFELNVYYINSVPWNQAIEFMLGRGISYVLFNAALWALALWAAAKAVIELRKPGAGSQADNRAGATILLWAVVSLFAVTAGRRFYGHYFLQVVPALSILAARGLQHLKEMLCAPSKARLARVIAGLLGLSVAVALVRFHHRTAVLALESLTGRRTGISETWALTLRQKEAEAISNIVLGEIDRGEPLYIWGYAQDVYWQTLCRPAARYLTPYYIDGRFPDAESRPAADDDPFWREARAALIDDLGRERPRIILDVRANIHRLPYREIVEFVEENYSAGESIGPDAARPLRIWRLKAGR